MSIGTDDAESWAASQVFDAWRESQVGPAWWSILNNVRSVVRTTLTTRRRRWWFSL